MMDHLLRIFLLVFSNLRFIARQVELWCAFAADDASGVLQE